MGGPLGDAFLDVVVALTLVLVRRAVIVDWEPFNVGEATAEVLLEIRGIFVGVSFGRPDTEFIADDGGSLELCETLRTPTDGEPAIVGS